MGGWSEDSFQKDENKCCNFEASRGVIGKAGKSQNWHQARPPHCLDIDLLLLYSVLEILFHP